jgi:hypothetical protein
MDAGREILKAIQNLGKGLGKVSFGVRFAMANSEWLLMFLHFKSLENSPHLVNPPLALALTTIKTLTHKRIIFSMSGIFDDRMMCSTPEIFLAILSKSNCSMIIVSTKLFAIIETMSGY